MNKSSSNTINNLYTPNHVAIIMDGNGRWAKKRGMNRTFGHKNAIKAVRSTIESCGDYNIPYLTLYTFSAENWNRPKTEVTFLMQLLSKTIKSEIGELNEKGVRVEVIGDLSLMPKNVNTSLEKAIELTKNNTKSTLILALSYGSKNEILAAVKNIVTDTKKGKITIDDINETLFEKNLYTKNYPPVDLLIRTSGEQRISNFLLWQIAYAELYFTPTLWPDFSKEEFRKALLEYQKRERRFGKISEQLNTD